MQIVAKKTDALDVVVPIDENEAIRMRLTRVVATTIDAAGLGHPRITQEARGANLWKEI